MCPAYRRGRRWFFFFSRGNLGLPLIIHVYHCVHIYTRLHHKGWFLRAPAMSTRVELERDRERWSFAPDNIRDDISDGPLTAPLGSHNRTAVWRWRRKQNIYRNRIIVHRQIFAQSFFDFHVLARFVVCCRFYTFFSYLLYLKITAPGIYDENGKHDIIYLYAHDSDSCYSRSF